MMDGVVLSLGLLVGFMVWAEGTKPGQKVGPYNIIVDKFERCQDEGSRQVIVPTRIYSKGNGTYRFNDTIFWDVPIDENYAMQTLVYSWGNGGWKMFYNSTIKGCKALFEKIPYGMENYTRAKKLKPGTCPIPKGNYSMSAWGSLTFESDVHFPVFIYNKYKTQLSFFYEDKKVGCVTAYSETVPKK